MGDERESNSENLPAIPNLDYDVVFDIFSRIQVKPLIQYRLISKPFLSLIQNPLFIKLHLTKTFIQNPKDRIFIYYESPDYLQFYFTLFNLDSAAKTLIQDKKTKFQFKAKNGYLRIAGSTNGLICFFDTNYFTYLGTLFIWNPILGKFKVLPDLHSAHRINATFSHAVVGFAFVSETVDFKVVLILYDSDADSDTVVFVYTLGENCWRKIDALVPCYMPKSWSENVFVNGSVHWMAFKGHNSSSKVPERIMLFDMSNEVFGEFRLPNSIDPSYTRPKLSASCNGDSLSLFAWCNNQWEVWLMREYGAVESWVKQYTIVESRIYSLLKFVDNGMILAVTVNENLAFFDPESHKCEETNISGPSSSFCVVGYTESLALLDKGNNVFRA